MSIISRLFPNNNGPLLTKDPDNNNYNSSSDPQGPVSIEDVDIKELNNEDEPQYQAKINTPEIPEELFVEYSTPEIKNKIETRNLTPTKKMNPTEKETLQFDLQYLYIFLEKDYQQEGYNDALSNPDMSSMEEKVKLIRRQLDITIAKVKTYYSNILRNMNFHIESRSRNGMVDIVDELISKKITLEEELSKVDEIANGAKSETGLSETLIMSYRLGFKNGYAAISHSQLI
ncbi:MAG: hypothetical protein RLZZ71_2130 [Bacteroidota bacterium]|jgi:hypothetical protein